MRPPNGATAVARVTAGVTMSHVPAIGAASDLGKAGDGYWQPLFAGFEFSRRWIAQRKPDVIFLVYNDHATAFDLNLIPLSPSAAGMSMKLPTRAGGRARCPRWWAPRTWLGTSAKP